MKLQDSTGKIIDRRKVYYVTIYNSRHMIVAFLGSGLHYVSERTDAALFDTKEEAKELIRKVKSNGVCNKPRYFAKAKVPSDIQYKVTEWKF